MILEVRSVGGHYGQENTTTGSLNQVRNLTYDVVDISLGECNTRLPGQVSLSTKAVVNKYCGVTLPTMSTGSIYIADLRNRGVQCYGIGPAIYREGVAFGFGGQERILIPELNQFVRINWEVVFDLAARQ